MPFLMPSPLGVLCLHPALAHPQPLQFLQDALPRLSPPTLAGLLACHTSLGLGNTTKLLRRTATEYQRRPEASPSVDMLLGIMAGLVAGGKDYIRDLPVQLLTRWGCCGGPPPACSALSISMRRMRKL